MPASVIANSWKKSGLLPGSFWEGEGSPRTEQLDTAEKVVEQQYLATDAILNEFREYFPTIMTAQEYTELLPGEDLTNEQPPTAKEFVEHVLAAESSSSEEDEVEVEERVSEDAFEQGFNIVEKFVHQNSDIFGPKVVGNLFMMKQGWQRRKIEVELAKKRGQACITDFVN